MKKVFALVFAVMMLASLVLVPVSASNGGSISTDKSEYLEGEMIHVYFEFPNADSNRQIWVYRGDVKMENRVWVISATGTENHGLHPIFWPANTLATPGDYTMVVMNKNGDAYSTNITANFTVKSNPNLTRTPTISLDKDTYGLEDIVTVTYDGITDALPWDKILQITIYDDMDFPASSEPIYLWDTREFLGISGTLEIALSDFELWEGDFYAILESNDTSMDLSYSRVNFKIVDNASSDATETPVATVPGGDETTPTPPAQDDATDLPINTDDGNDNKQEESASDSNTLLYVVIAIAAVLFVALVVVIVLLAKKKK